MGPASPSHATYDPAFIIHLETHLDIKIFRRKLLSTFVFRRIHKALYRPS